MRTTRRATAAAFAGVLALTSATIPTAHAAPSTGIVNITVTDGYRFQVPQVSISGSRGERWSPAFTGWEFRGGERWYHFRAAGLPVDRRPVVVRATVRGRTYTRVATIPYQFTVTSVFIQGPGFAG